MSETRVKDIGAAYKKTVFTKKPRKTVVGRSQRAGQGRLPCGPTPKGITEAFGSRLGWLGTP